MVPLLSPVLLLQCEMDVLMFVNAESISELFAEVIPYKIVRRKADVCRLPALVAQAHPLLSQPSFLIKRLNLRREICMQIRVPNSLSSRSKVRLWMTADTTAHHPSASG